MGLPLSAGGATGGILRPTLWLPPYTTGGLGRVSCTCVCWPGYWRDTSSHSMTSTLHHRWVRVGLPLSAGGATGGIFCPPLWLPPYTTGGLGWVYLCLLAGLLRRYFVHSTTSTLHHRWVRVGLLVSASLAYGGIFRPALRLPPYTTGGLCWVSTSTSHMSLAYQLMMGRRLFFFIDYIFTWPYSTGFYSAIPFLNWGRKSFAGPSALVHKRSQSCRFKLFFTLAILKRR